MFPNHFEILAQLPRLLVVRLNAPGLTETLAVARAPRSYAPDEARATWWEEMGRRAATCGIGHFTIDANGTTGYEVTQNIGDYGDPQEENRGGNHCHAFLREHGLAAVNAVCETEGPSCT